MEVEDDDRGKVLLEAARFICGNYFGSDFFYFGFSSLGDVGS